MDFQAIMSRYEPAEFRYGAMDCCLFVMNVIRDVTGVDYAEPWRGSYSNELGAFRIIKKHGGLVNLLSTALGRQISPIWGVKPGDPVLIGPPFVERDTIAEGVGIYDGSTLVYLTEKGLARALISAGRGCWHV